LKEKIIIFDTTLRDGEQSPGASLNLYEKLEIAHQLAKLKVDVIEAGFPISSPAQFDAVYAIASEVDVMPTIAALAGQSYTTMTMGRDLFDANYDKSRYAFTIMHGRNPRIGMVADNYYFYINLGLDEGSLHEVYSDTPSVDVSAEHPELTQKLKTLTLGYYKTAQYMPYHNKRSDIKKSNKATR